jgi:spermidine/putrescine transport system substrate-binding protein
MEEFNPLLSRRGFFTATGGISMAAFLAACGSSSSSSSSSSSGSGTAAGGGTSASAPAAPKFNPASEPSGPLQVFEWQGYQDPHMWADYINGPYGKTSPLKFTFLQDDQQALAKAASGVNYDLMHPCIAYWKNWQQAGLIQAYDTSLLPNLSGIPKSILSRGQDTNGLQWAVPFDIGFSSIVYRADRVKPATLSWDVMTNPQYKGRISMYSDEVTMIKIGAMINAGKQGQLLPNPSLLTQAQIDASKATLLAAAPNWRNFWSSETDMENDFVNGNIDIAYSWPDGYWNIKNHAKMKGVPVEYMWPQEGRLAWVCSLVLGSQTKQPGHATLAVAAANEPKTAVWLTTAYEYGGAQQKGVVASLEAMPSARALVKAFSLDDPAAFAPPVSFGAHGSYFEQFVPNREAMVKAGQEVKASVGA